MTDLRIIECAKAISATRFYEGGTKRPWELAEQDFERFIPLATACVLKWLEQEATGEMGRATWWAVSYLLDDDQMRAVYTAMCAQAAKEIGELMHEARA